MPEKHIGTERRKNPSETCEDGCIAMTDKLNKALGKVYEAISSKVSLRIFMWIIGGAGAVATLLFLLSVNTISGIKADAATLKAQVGIDATKIQVLNETDARISKSLANIETSLEDIKEAINIEKGRRERKLLKKDTQ